MIYLATAYSSPDRAVLQASFEMAYLILKQLQLLPKYRDNPIFCPIVYRHQFYSTALNAPKALDTWHLNKHMLDLSSEMIVCVSEAVRESEGVQLEISHAQARAIPVLYAGFEPHNHGIGFFLRKESLTCTPL